MPQCASPAGLGFSWLVPRWQEGRRLCGWHSLSRHDCQRKPEQLRAQSLSRMSDSSGTHPEPVRGVCSDHTLALHESHASRTFESLWGSFGGVKEVAVSALNLNFFALLGVCLILKRNFLSGANLWGKENICTERDVLGKRVLCFPHIIEEWSVWIWCFCLVVSLMAQFPLLFAFITKYSLRPKSAVETINE